MGAMWWGSYFVTTMLVFWTVFLGGADIIADITTRNIDREGIFGRIIEEQEYLERIPLFVKISSAAFWIVITLVLIVGEDKASKGPLRYLMKLVDLFF